MNVGSPRDQIHTWGLNVLHLLQAPVCQYDFFFFFYAEVSAFPSLPPLVCTRGRQRRHKVKGAKRQRRTKAQTDSQINHGVRGGSAAPLPLALRPCQAGILLFRILFWRAVGGGLRQRCSAGYTRVCGVHPLISPSAWLSGVCRPSAVVFCHRMVRA